MNDHQGTSSDNGKADHSVLTESDLRTVKAAEHLCRTLVGPSHNVLWVDGIDLPELRNRLEDMIVEQGWEPVK